MGGEISSSQSAAQKAYEDYQKKRNSRRLEQKEEAAEEEKKGSDILQEFRDRPRPNALPHACETWSGVWLGSLYDAMDADFVEREHISHAVSGTLAQDPFNGKVTRLIAIVDDEDPGDIWKWFERVSDFIDDALRQGGQVLVHCEWGVSRSPTLVAAYLMRVSHRSANSCLEDLKALRDCVSPNKHFLKALEEWQVTLKIPDSPAKNTEPQPMSVLGGIQDVAVSQSIVIQFGPKILPR